jgi:hypothetical protein
MNTSKKRKESRSWNIVFEIYVSSIRFHKIFICEYQLRTLVNSLPQVDPLNKDNCPCMRIDIESVQIGCMTDVTDRRISIGVAPG